MIAGFILAFLRHSKRAFFQPRLRHANFNLVSLVFGFIASGLIELS